MNLDCCNNCVAKSNSMFGIWCTKFEAMIPNPEHDVCSSHKSHF